MDSINRPLLHLRHGTEPERRQDGQEVTHFYKNYLILG